MKKACEHQDFNWIIIILFVKSYFLFLNKNLKIKLLL